MQEHLTQTRGAGAELREGLSEVLLYHLGSEESPRGSQPKREWTGKGETNPWSRTPKSFRSREGIWEKEKGDCNSVQVLGWGKDRT